MSCVLSDLRGHSLRLVRTGLGIFILFYFLFVSCAGLFWVLFRLKFVIGKFFLLSLLNLFQILDQ